MMDQADIQAIAAQLQALLQKYVPISEAAQALEDALSPLLTQALTGQLPSPVDWNTIPGARTFEETDARTLAGLESAYANFKFAVTGGEPAWVAALRARRGR